jgi:hypothetical protein
MDGAYALTADAATLRRMSPPAVSWEPICWDCGAVALPPTGACPQCRAELRGAGEHGPSPGARTPRVTRRWHASDAARLRTVSGWIHDASWDDEAMTLADDGTLVIPFRQLTTTVEECGQTELRRVARAADGRVRSDRPVVHCRIMVRHATSVAIAMEERDAPRVFSGCVHDEAARHLTFWAVIGPELHLDVERLDLTIEVTDQLAHYERHDVFMPAVSWDAEAGHWW